MHILKKNKGIDFKANDTGLHGSVTIQFGDPTTGKVVDEVKHDNFFTDALKSIYNQCPFGLDKVGLRYYGIGTTDNITKMYNVFEWLLGGIMLFPDSLGNGTTDFYAPFTNYPTALASMESYDHRSPKQGNWNSVESAALSNGYRYVYDWNTSQGNGSISAVALSHRRCYEYFNDGAVPYYPKSTNFSYNSAAGYRMNQFGGESRRIPFAVCDDGVLTSDYNFSRLKCRFYKVRPYNFHLLASLSDPVPEYLDDGVTRPYSFAWETDLSSEFDANGAYIGYQFENGTLYAWQKNSTGESAIKLITIDIADGSVLTRNTYTFNAPNAQTSSYHFAIKNGSIYMPATVNGKVYKCDIATLNVTEIACNAVADDTNSCWATEGSDNIYGNGFVINNGVASDMQYVTTNWNAGRNQFQTNLGRNIVYEKGVWIVNATPAVGELGAQIKTPYLATKNNLDETKTKTGDKTMKVTYTVTQV